MLYYLFEYLDKLNVPGAGMFSYISFRSASAVITSLFISLLIGKRIILYLQRKQVGEVVRDLGLEGQYQKQGTPSMGGIIILASIIILMFGIWDDINGILAPWKMLGQALATSVLVWQGIQVRIFGNM